MTKLSLQVKNVVSGYYPDIDVIREVSMNVRKGEITCIIGPNGSGKSTLLKTIYGFLSARKGTILLDEQDITRCDAAEMPRLKMGYILQRRSVFASLTVRENLQMGAWLFREDKEKVNATINHVFETYPILKSRENIDANRLSGGEQRMLELARALMLQPRVLLVDEPSAGLAPKVAEELYRTLENLRDKGITLLIVDQNIKRAVEMADYLYVLNRGQVQLGSPQEKIRDEVESIIKKWLV